DRRNRGRRRPPWPFLPWPCSEVLSRVRSADTQTAIGCLRSGDVTAGKVGIRGPIRKPLGIPLHQDSSRDIRRPYATRTIAAAISPYAGARQPRDRRGAIGLFEARRAAWARRGIWITLAPAPSA